jgi:hypothetical protein
MPKKYSTESNKKLIIILGLVGILSIGVLVSLYFTFGQSSLQNNPATINFSEIVPKNSKIPTIKTFGDETTADSSKTVKLDVNPKDSNTTKFQFDSPSSLDKTVTSSAQSSRYLNDRIIPTISSRPKVDFEFDSRDKEILSMYVDLETVDFNGIVSAKILDKNKKEVIVMKLAAKNILRRINIDFPNTFRLSNEDRLPTSNDRIILYYPAEKRAAYLGEYISDVFDFEYEGQNYWLSTYLGDLIISKPDFKDWKFVGAGDYKIYEIVKKSDFEFEVVTKFTYEDFDEYKKEFISPQKYIIDGIFNPVSD